MLKISTDLALTKHLSRLALLLILTAGFHFSGLSQHFSDISYRWLNSVAKQPDGSRSILLVNASGEALAKDEIYWRKLIREINAHQPKHITLAVQPQNIGPSFYRDLAASASANLAIEPVLNANGSIGAGSHTRAGKLPQSWLLPIDVNGDGTLGYHTQLNRLSVTASHTHNLPANEILALRLGNGSLNKDAEPPHYFRVVAPRIAHPLLQVETDYVIESGLVADLVTDRWVIIGQGDIVSGVIRAGHSTPDSNSSLQQRGHLLAALLEGRWLHVLTKGQHALIVAGLAGLWYLVFLLAPRSYQRWLYICWVLTTTLSLAATLRWLDLQLPAAELIAIPFLYMIIDTFYRRREEKIAFTQVVEMTEPRMIKQRELSDFFISEDYWEKILSMVRQTLQLEAAMILERPGTKFHLDIVVKFGCSEALLLEKRRDFRRSPFDTALQFGGPIQPERPFFDIDPHLEVQYMCPLYYRGEILGFWALSLLRETVLRTPHFEDILRKYSTQISELLYNRKIMAQGNIGLVALGEKASELTYDKNIVLQRITTIESQLSSHISLIDVMKTGCLLYDLFGNLILANTAAQTFARNNGVAIFDGNALDLLIKLTGCSAERGRDTLLDIIIHNSHVTLPVTLKKDIATHVLYIRLVQESENAEPDAAPRPFDAQGILFELIDNSRIARLHREKETLLVNLTASAIDMVQGAYFAASAIKRTLVQNEDSTEDIEDLENILGDMATVMSSLNDQLYLSEDIIRSGHLYVDMKTAVENSISRHSYQVVARMMEVKTNLSDYCELAKANVSDLERVLERIWTLIIETAEEGSQLQILVDQKEMSNKNVIRCAFKNQGFGLTPGIIDAFNRRDLQHLTPTLSALRLAMDDLKGWGGALLLRSTLGKSLTVIVVLETFSDHK